MTHLTAGELKTWYEQGRADDRDRVIGHLAECEACRRSLSALAMAAEPDAVVSPKVTAAELVPHGYGARKEAPSTRSWAAWLRPAYGLAGAAMLVFAVVWLTTSREGNQDQPVRSAELLALSPAGTTSAVDLRWESPFAAARYRVVVRDAAGAVVFRGETSASSLVVDQSARAQMATMVEYTWTVSALDAAGEVIAESKPVTFRYQP